MNIKRISIMVVFAALMILLAACGTKTQDAILGRWEVQSPNAEQAMIFSFKADGKLTIWVGDVPIEGSYTWIDEDTFQITMVMMEESQNIVATVEVNGDRMTITNETGDVDVLLRVK